MLRVTYDVELVADNSIIIEASVIYFRNSWYVKKKVQEKTPFESIKSRIDGSNNAL
jgi:hypothetical protein